VRFRRGAELDPSQVSDRRGMRGPVGIGVGGGVVGLIFLVVQLLAGGGGDGGLLLGSGEGEGTNSDLAAECRTGADAEQREDCAIVAVINSVQEYWSGTIRSYEPTPTVFFTQQTRTACGTATSSVGPFYCPPDRTVYIDLGFYDDLRTRFGAQGGRFAEAYVIAHEYGHHVENLLGVLGRSQDGSSGPTSSSVRIELMADCFAGMWAQGAVATGFVEELTEADIRDGLDAAAAIGDDRIQQKLEGRVEPESWTHGSAEMRQRWLLTGYRGAADVSTCDTFSAPTL
jgi:uncharacterized protein